MTITHSNVVPTGPATEAAGKQAQQPTTCSFDPKWYPSVKAEEARLREQIEDLASKKLRPKGPAMIAQKRIAELEKRIEALYEDPEKYFAEAQPE